MGTALWIVQGLLAVAFLGSGLMKLIKSQEDAKAQMAWIDDFPAGFFKFIGASEVAGALGMVLPGLTGIAPILTPVAAVGLVIVMLGAAVTHIRYSEAPMAMPAFVLGLLAAFVAYGRFVAVPFS